MYIKPGQLELETASQNLPNSACFVLVSKECYEKVKKWLGFSVFGGVKYYVYRGRIVSTKRG